MKIGVTFIVFLAALLSSVPHARAMQSGTKKISYYEKTGIPQLPNNANLCYLNAVVQVLYNNDLLRNLILNMNPGGSSLLSNLKNTIDKISNKNATEEDISNLAKSLNGIGANPSEEQLKKMAESDLKKFGGNLNNVNGVVWIVKQALDMQDSTAAFNYIQSDFLMEKINNNFINSKVIEAIKKKFGIIEVDPAEFVRPLFDELEKKVPAFKNLAQMQIKSTITNPSSENTENTSILTINVDQSGDLLNAIHNNFNTQTEGSSRRNITKKIVAAPQLLTISLQNMERLGDPQASNPSISPALDIKNFLVDQSNPDYQLSGAVIYIAGGKPNEPGHYKAAIKKGSQWFICENENIARVDENRALADIKAGATILLYQNTAAVLPAQGQPSQPPKPQVKPTQPVPPQQRKEPEQKKPMVVKSGQTQEEIKQQQQFWLQKQQQEEAERQRRAEEERRRQEQQRAEAARRAQLEQSRRAQQQAQQRTTPSSSQTLQRSLQELTNAFGRLSRQLQVRYYY